MLAALGIRRNKFDMQQAAITNLGSCLELLSYVQPSCHQTITMGTIALWPAQLSTGLLHMQIPSYQTS